MISASTKLQQVFKAPMGSQFLTRGTRIISRDGWYQVVTPSVPDPSRNEIILSAIDENKSEATIDEMVEFYGKQKLPFKWCVGPFTKPSSFQTLLEQRNYTNWWCRGMWIDLVGLAEAKIEGIEVAIVSKDLWLEEYINAFALGWSTEKAIDPKKLDDLRNDILWALDQPHQKFRFFVALDKGQPIGTSGYIASEDCVYFVGGNVLPAYRGRGIYRALISARAEEARKRGFKFAVTHAREKTSAPILEQLQWETTYRYPIFLIESPER